MNEFLKLLKLLLPWPARAFNPITDIFVYGIVLSFFICLGIFLWKTILRSRLISNLVNEVSKHGKPAKPEILPQLKKEFDRNSSELAEVWQEFQNSLITREPKENQEKIVYKTDETSLFFSEERLLDQHLNLRFWNSIPALLLGLGILGTFVGLVSGLTSFSDPEVFAQTDKIRAALKELLPGVSTAFVTSVWGMLTSLLFNGLEKWRINSISKAIVGLQHTLDQLFTLTTQEEIAFRQQDELAQQTQALKAFSTDLADEIKIAMDNIISESHDRSTRNSQEVIQELRKVPEAISNAMEPNLNSLNAIVGNLNATVTKSAGAIKSEIELERQEIAQGLRNAPEAISNAMVARLIPNISNLNTMVEELQKQSEKLDILHQNLMESRTQNTQNNQEIVQELRKVPEAISNAMEPNLNSLNMVVENLRNIHSRIETLAEMAGRISENLINLPQHVAQIASDVQELLKSIVYQTDEQFNQRLAYMDEFLQRSAQTLQDVQQSAGTLLQLQNEQIEAINNQLIHSRATLARGRDMLQEMNASIKNVHQITNTMQIVSQKLTEGAEKIEGAGQQLNRAGVAFNEGNQNALIVIRETADRIQNILNRSHPLLKDFTRSFEIIYNRLDRNFQNFQAIDEGLNGIFVEIEHGLNNYADTTRETINKYLTDFSEQLGQASEALAGNVKILKDSVEELTEMNENQLTTLVRSFEVIKESMVELSGINERPTDHIGNK